MSATVGLIVATPFACAKVNKQIAVGSITIEQLGVDEPAIVVSNPFYPIKSLMRDVSTSLNISKVSKVTARANTLNDKAAELLKIRTVAPANEKLLNRAINEYQTAVYQYGFALGRLSADGIDGQVTLQLQKLVATTALAHLRLVDDLLASALPNGEQAVLVDVADRLADATVRSLAASPNIDFRAIFKSESPEVADSDSLFRQAEAVSVLARRSAIAGANTIAQDLLLLRGELLTTGAAAFTETNSKLTLADELLLLSGSKNERLQSILYLLGTKQFDGNQSLINARNQLLIQVFAR